MNSQKASCDFLAPLKAWFFRARQAAAVAALLLVSSCALLQPRIDGERVNFRVTAQGGNLREVAFLIPVEGRLTHVQVLHPAQGGGREIVWSSRGSSDVASLNAHGLRHSVGYGLDHGGLTQEVAARTLLDGEVYVVYVTVVDRAGKVLRGGAVFAASAEEGVGYGCDSIRECSAYLLSTVT
jgi:hypothetical protein